MLGKIYENLDLPTLQMLKNATYYNLILHWVKRSRCHRIYNKTMGSIILSNFSALLFAIFFLKRKIVKFINKIAISTSRVHKLIIN